jgi:hypothetical protein
MNRLWGADPVQGKHTNEMLPRFWMSGLYPCRDEVHILFETLRWRLDQALAAWQAMAPLEANFL